MGEVIVTLTDRFAFESSILPWVLSNVAPPTLMDVAPSEVSVMLVSDTSASKLPDASMSLMLRDDVSLPDMTSYSKSPTATLASMCMDPTNVPVVMPDISPSAERLNSAETSLTEMDPVVPPIWRLPTDADTMAVWVVVA